ncbi:MAG: hypothetical protein KatS3mg010_1760 [Acidimicrobiia bacterium]|nr:MAG: hypothetical protein KatS3mg010_1760 [Acidimicrobiia bacterium]
MHDTVEVAARGKTAVAVVTEEFETLAHTMAANAGRPGLRVLVLPYPLETRVEAEVRAIAVEHWPRALAALGASVTG